MSKKPQTRAQNDGIATKPMSHKLRKFLWKAREQLQQMSYDWHEFPGGAGLERAATDLSAALDIFENESSDFIEYLNEPPESD